MLSRGASGDRLARVAHSSQRAVSCHVLPPRRDFSNGFLVAEIFSRYYDKDIQMHSFDNGNSTRVKRDNWAQLLKFFRKRDVMPGGQEVSDRTVEAIIHCRTGAVIEFLNQVYEFLSGRKYVAPVARAWLCAPAVLTPAGHSRQGARTAAASQE